jgi:hypothetical protein
MWVRASKLVRSRHARLRTSIERSHPRQPKYFSNIFEFVNLDASDSFLRGVRGAAARAGRTHPRLSADPTSIWCEVRQKKFPACAAA